MNPPIAAMPASLAPAGPAAPAADPGCTTARTALVPLPEGVASQRRAAQRLHALRAANAINLDAGGKAKLLDVPSDSSGSCTFPVKGGCERFVSASFAIPARPLPARR